MQRFLTKGDAARRSKLSTSGIRWAVKDGRLRVAARTEGGMSLFTESEVERFRREREARRVLAAGLEDA